MAEADYLKESMAPSMHIYVCDLFCICKCFACMYVCTPHLSGAQGGQNRASDILELELQMVVTYHMSSGNRT